MVMFAESQRKRCGFNAICTGCPKHKASAAAGSPAERDEWRTPRNPIETNQGQAPWALQWKCTT
jgi:hypothetical protein